MWELACVQQKPGGNLFLQVFKNTFQMAVVMVRLHMLAMPLTSCWEKVSIPLFHIAAAVSSSNVFYIWDASAPSLLGVTTMKWGTNEVTSQFLFRSTFEFAAFSYYFLFPFRSQLKAKHTVHDFLLLKRLPANCILQCAASNNIQFSCCSY